jgi:cyclase
MATGPMCQPGRLGACRPVIISGAMPRLLALGVLLAGFVSVVAAQGGRTAPADGVEVLQLRPNVFMVAGTGANVTVQVGEDGVIVVDSGSAMSSGQLLAEIKKITSAPIRYVINTSAGADHVGGNEAVSKAGITLLGTRVTGLAGSANFNGSGPGPASILAIEQVLTRMSAPTGQTSPYSVASWPTETFPFGRKNMYLNGEGIEMVHQPAAHSDGDAIVFFRRSDVIVAGDIIDARRFPMIDVAKGGSIQGELDALNRLTEMAIPSVPIITREDGTLVVPGHGRVYDQFDVVAYRDMVTIIRDRVRDMMAAGMTLDQIKAAGPAKGYSGRYGSDSGPWTTNAFIEAIHRSLSQVKS